VYIFREGRLSLASVGTLAKEAVGKLVEGGI